MNAEQQNPFSLENKNIIITGASSGIGRETAIQCSKQGATLLLIGRNSERLSETLKTTGAEDRHRMVSLDLTNYERLEGLVQEHAAIMGPFHGLVNAAGISTTLPLKNIKPEKLENFFSQNVVTAINLSRIFTRKGIVSGEGASIIMFASVMGMVGEVAKTMYASTKGALIAATRSMALELAPRKICVNSVSPGVVVTPMTDQAVYSQESDLRQKVEALHPLGLGNSVDVANACIFLLSDASRWITGTNLVIDGGYTAR